MMDNPQDRIEWLAFRYVANELDEAERDEFELQLASDQESREAVARMVQKTTSISVALVEPSISTAASSRANWSRDVARWFAVGLGSCLVLFVAFVVWHQSRDSLPNSAPLPDVASNSPTSADLAYLWAESRPGIDDLIEGELTDTSELLWHTTDGEPAEESLVAPSWMLAAVAGINSDVNSDLQVKE